MNRRGFIQSLALMPLLKFDFRKTQRPAFRRYDVRSVYPQALIMKIQLSSLYGKMGGRY